MLSELMIIIRVLLILDINDQRQKQLPENRGKIGSQNGFIL